MSHAILQLPSPSRTSQWIIVIAMIVAGVVVVGAHFARSPSLAQPSSPDSDAATETEGKKPLSALPPKRIYRDPGGPGRRF